MSIPAAFGRYHQQRMSDLIPFWAPWSGRILVAAAVVIAATLLITWRRHRRRRDGVPRCAFCAYDLSLHDDHAPCPECARVTPADKRLTRRRAWTLGAVAIVILMCVAALPIRRMMTHGPDYYLRLRPLYDVFPRINNEDHVIGDFAVTRRVDRRRDAGMIMDANHPDRLRITHRGARLPDLPMPDAYAITMRLDVDEDAPPPATVRRGVPTIRVRLWDGGNSGSSERRLTFELRDGVWRATN